MQHPQAQFAGEAQGGLLDRDAFLNSEQLAGLLAIEPSTLDQWASKGGGPAFHKIGGVRRYHPSDVRTWLSERRFAATGDPRPADVATESEPPAPQPRKPAKRRAATGRGRRAPARDGDSTSAA